MKDHIEFKTSEKGSLDVRMHSRLDPEAFKRFQSCKTFGWTFHAEVHPVTFVLSSRDHEGKTIYKTVSPRGGQRGCDAASRVINETYKELCQK